MKSSFIWKPARGEFDDGIAKFVGIQLSETNERMLIAGNVEFHSHLADGVRIKKNGPVTLFAAGSFDREGAIKSWHSLGYSFQTPFEEHDAVEKIIASQLSKIQENWGQLAYFAVEL